MSSAVISVLLIFFLAMINYYYDVNCIWSCWEIDPTIIAVHINSPPHSNKKTEKKKSMTQMWKVNSSYICSYCLSEQKVAPQPWVLKYQVMSVNGRCKSFRQSFLPDLASIVVSILHIHQSRPKDCHVLCIY